jgi:hypothetical protein
MKKRTLKKWIPKDTIYCYHNFKRGDCKFYTANKNVTEEQKQSPYMNYNNGYCKLMNVEIFDMCKVCGLSESGWFKLDDYTGLSSYYYKKNREWRKKQTG